MLSVPSALLSHIFFPPFLFEALCFEVRDLKSEEQQPGLFVQRKDLLLVVCLWVLIPGVGRLKIKEHNRPKATFASSEKRKAGTFDTIGSL